MNYFDVRLRWIGHVLFLSKDGKDADRVGRNGRRKEFSRTESRILGALSKLDDFFRNPQVRTCSVAVSGTSRNSNSENREPTGDRSIHDLCPEVRYSSHHFGNLNSPKVEDYPHMVTGGPEQIRNRPHMTTGIQEEIPYCCPGILSGKQKKGALYKSATISQ